MKRKKTVKSNNYQNTIQNTFHIYFNILILHSPSSLYSIKCISLFIFLGYGKTINYEKSSFNRNLFDKLNNSWYIHVSVLFLIFFFFGSYKEMIALKKRIIVWKVFGIELWY